METGLTPVQSKTSATGKTLLIYMVFLVLLITLIPFRFRFPHRIVFSGYFYISGFIANMLLFIPVGLFSRLARGKTQDKLCLKELFLGLLLSILIEILQCFIPARVSSGYDLLANASGAWLGARLSDWLRHKINIKQVTGLFALELPLMNLVYLLIPLFWLNGLSAAHRFRGLVLLGLLGIFGTFLLLAVYCHGFKTRGIGTPSSNRFSLLIMTWFLISSFPALLKYPLPVIGLAMMIGIISKVRLVLVEKFPNKKREKHQEIRRYELPTLQKLIWIYVAYLILSFIWPTTLAPDLETMSINYMAERKARLIIIFRFLEGIAAFVLLGYMMAQMRGRKNEPVKTTLARVLAIASGSAVLLILARGFRGAIVPGALTVLEAALLIAASLGGAVIYRLQLTAIAGCSLKKK